MIIGKLYSPAQLAFLEKGRQLPSLAMSSINSVIQRVSFPAVALIQEDRDHVRNVMRKMIQTSTFLVFPLLTGLGICASSVVPLFFGEQWYKSIPFVWLFCFSFMLYPFHTINLQTLSALGRSDIFLKLEVIKTIINVIMLFCTYKLGPLWIVGVASFIGGPIGVFINAMPNKRLLNYSVLMQIKDTIPTFGICLAMAMLIGPLGLLKIPIIVLLMIQVFVGGVAFFFMAWIFRLHPMREYVSVMDSVLGRHVPACLKGLYLSLLKRLELGNG
jgi:O-antigen/teichoic acid export membrane protein